MYPPLPPSPKVEPVNGQLIQLIFLTLLSMVEIALILSAWIYSENTYLGTASEILNEVGHLWVI